MPWYDNELETFNTPLVYPLQRNVVWEGNITKFPSQMEQRVSYQTVPRNIYNAQTKPLTSSELSSLITLFTNCKGTLKPFKITIEGENKYCRFNSTSLNIAKPYPNHYIVEISIIEVHPSEILPNP